MEYIITKNPKVALILIPWFLTSMQSREEIYLELRERLETNPDETFVLLVLEGDLIKAMAFGYCRYKDVFIWQARKTVGVSKQIIDLAFEKIKDWAKSKGHNHIAAVPGKSKKVFGRRWGFKESVNNEVVLEI